MKVGVRHTIGLIREALWNLLRVYGVGGQLLKGIQAFYREANACVRVGGKFSGSFAVEMGVREVVGA